jgi:hypothetical protein
MILKFFELKELGGWWNLQIQIFPTLATVMFQHMAFAHAETALAVRGA